MCPLSKQLHIGETKRRPWPNDGSGQHTRDKRSREEDTSKRPFLSLIFSSFLREHGGLQNFFTKQQHNWQYFFVLHTMALLGINKRFSFNFFFKFPLYWQTYLLQFDIELKLETSRLPQSTFFFFLQLINAICFLGSSI